MSGRPSRAAALVAAGAAVAFALIAWGVVGGGWITALDGDLAAWIAARATPAWLAVMSVVSNLHRPRGILAGTAVVAVVLLWRSERVAVLLVLLTVGGGATLNHWLKHSFMRLRPGDSLASLTTTDFSFPSGHVANATLLYGAVAALVLWHTRSSVVRVAALLGAALAVGLVATSRLVLGAHYLSDAVAGALVGVGWLALCLFAVMRWRGRPVPAP